MDDIQGSFKGILFCGGSELHAAAKMYGDFEVGFILRWCLSAGHVEISNVSNHVQQCDVMYCAVMKCTLASILSIYFSDWRDSLGVRQYMRTMGPPVELFAHQWSSKFGVH